MDGWMDGWMHGWMDGCMDGCMDACMDGWMQDFRVKKEEGSAWRPVNAQVWDGRAFGRGRGRGRGFGDERSSGMPSPQWQAQIAVHNGGPQSLVAGPGGSPSGRLIPMRQAHSHAAGSFPCGRLSPIRQAKVAVPVAAPAFVADTGSRLQWQAQVAGQTRCRIQALLAWGGGMKPCLLYTSDAADDTPC
eukprot:41106-Chlamydomonas_euryale.AAC.1